MNRIILRALPLLLAAVIILCGGVSAIAADAPEPTPASDTLDALHGGAPPTMPGAATPANDTITPDTPPIYTPEPPLSFTTPEPIAAVPPLYPSDVQGVEDNGARWVIKTYELGADESPDGIPRGSFEHEGWRYDLTDILKKETAAADVREHTETVAVNSETKDMAAILPLLAPTIDYTSEDGYAGALALDIASITVEQAGTKTSSYTVSAAREYPHLSAPDTALIPKTITDNDRTLTLAGVDWQTQNGETIDYEQLPGSYTATATYTAASSKTVVTGYVVTAEYTGTVAKLITGKTVYTAYFAGTLLTPLTPELTPEPEPEREPVNPLPAAAGATAGAGLLGGVVFFFFLRKNVKVHNLKDGKYVPIGKTRVTAKNPVMDITPFADKAVTGSFILVLDAPAAKALSGKAVTVNYGDRSLQHIIESNGGEYQFEVDF
jgi:hypothetical protein